MLDLTDPVAQEISKARITLLLQNPFFGAMALYLDPILVNSDEKDSWCHTAATDGRSMWFSRQFVNNLTPNELIFVVAHEIMHVIFEHLGRRGDRDAKIFNMATDYVVNYTLVKGGVGEMPPIGLYSDKYTDEMTCEQVYDDLIKNNVKIEVPLDLHLDGLGGAGGNGSSDKTDGGQSVTITVTGENGPPVLTQQELDDIRTEVRRNAIQAAQSALAQGDMAGCVPAGVRRMLSELNEHKMDWRAMLDAHLRSALKDNYTFMKISRRDLGGGFMCPAQDDLEIVEVDISIDASGSMTDQMLRDILSEVKGIMVTFGDFKLRVWTFDTRVYNMQEYGPQNIDDIHEYQLHGGGGTDFMCNWEYMKDNGIEPHRLVMFTDGYPCGSWGEENYCDTLFVIHGNKSIVAPFGVTAYYD